jgi:hypothetical protein
MAHAKPTSTISRRMAIGITVPPTEAPVAKIPNARILCRLKWCPMVAIEGENRKPIEICIEALAKQSSLQEALIDPNAKTMTEQKLVELCSF